jgi:hypothetical protein
MTTQSLILQINQVIQKHTTKLTEKKEKQNELIWDIEKL